MSSERDSKTGGSGEDRDDYSHCEAYEGFRDLIVDIRSKYTHLNPITGKLFEHVRRTQNPRDLTLDETGQEFIRGGIVAIMAAWESYVHDIFQEAFNILLKIGSGEHQSLDSLHQFWPSCRTIIQEEIKRRACQKGDRVEVVAYDLLCAAEKSTGDEKVWVKLLHAHCENVLEKKTLLPIFSSQKSDQWAMTIDNVFRQLFKIDIDRKKKPASLSEILIDVGGFRYTIRLPGTDSQCDVHLMGSQTLANESSDRSHAIATETSDRAQAIETETSERSQAMSTETSDRSQAIKALHNISRLYYGVRCTLVHGNHKKTLQGALKDFPNDSAGFTMPSKNDTKVRDYYVKLYKRVEEYGRNAWVSYLDFFNLTRFYGSAANFLRLSVARWFHTTDEFKSTQRILIWNYDPDRPSKSIRTQSQS